MNRGSKVKSIVKQSPIVVQGKKKQSKFKCWVCGEPVVAVGLCRKHYQQMWRKNKGGFRERHRKFKERKLKLEQEILERYQELKKKKKEIVMIYGGWLIKDVVYALIRKGKIEAISAFISSKAPEDYWDFIFKE